MDEPLIGKGNKWIYSTSNKGYPNPHFTERAVMKQKLPPILLGLLLLFMSACSSRLPNIILVSIDTLRADHVSCYGYERQTTPILDSLALQGVLFELCQAQAPWTLPSHASMFTGLTVISHGTTLSGGYEHLLDPSLPSLPVFLQTQWIQNGRVRECQVSCSAIRIC